MNVPRRWLTLPALLLLTTASGCGYNRIQALDEQAKQARANIDAELLRRNDLIPNLVQTVQGAAQFEKSTFVQVAQARSGVQAAARQVTQAVNEGAEPDRLSQADANLASNLRLFLNVAVEAYPQLKADQNFTALQDELTETENRINVARRDYNEAVAQYNTYIRQFPQVLVAKASGARELQPFKAPPGVQTPPQVHFDMNQPAGTPAGSTP
jgi:LemA protein